MFLLNLFASFYDRAKSFWLCTAVKQKANVITIIVFFISLACIAANRFGLLPDSLSQAFPRSPFYAIHLAFSLILVQEIIELIFILAGSVSRAIGKQMEIMALVMLRDCFKDIGELEVHINSAHDYFTLLQIASTALAGLFLFISRSIFSKMHTTRGYQNLSSYINSKKCISVFLLCIFVTIGIFDLHRIFFQVKPSLFFQTFYTALIFADIFILLISQYHLGSFHDTFRYSGYAVSTLIMRIALSSPHHIGALLCVFSGIFILLLTWATQKWQLNTSKIG